MIGIILSCPDFVTAQSAFQRTYGSTKNEMGFCVHQTFDKGYILCGVVSQDSTNADIYLVKTDSLGDTLWIKTYGGPLNEFAESVQQTRDSGFVIAGTTYSYGQGQGDVFVIKTNGRGDTSWTRTYGGSSDELGQYIEQTRDEGYIIAGHTDTFGPRGDFYLIKTTPAGDTVWTRTFGGIKHDHGYCVQQTADTGYIIVGHSLSFNPSGGYYAVKTNSHGDTLWTRGYGGSVNSYCWFGRQTPDGGYIMTGSTDCFGAGGTDAWVVKTNALGDTLWTKTYGGSGSDWFNCVQLTADGGYILAGTTTSFGADSADVYLVRIDASGDTLWTKTFGGAHDDEGTFVSLTADGGYVISGTTKSFGKGGTDTYLIKTDKNGNTSCHESGTHTLTTKPGALMAQVQTFTGPTHSDVGIPPFGKSSGNNGEMDPCLNTVPHIILPGLSDLFVFPSPSNGSLWIESGQEMGLVRLFDCTGRLVYQQQIAAATLTMDISLFPSGVYILEALNRHVRIVKE